MKKSFLKWAGGKSKLLPQILPHIHNCKCLIEPFCGSGVVWLNAKCDRYLVGDINADIINVFGFIKKEGHSFIDYVKSFFVNSNNLESFKENRNLFNNTDDLRKRSALFIYLNRHCYNGLCRYNSKGVFNVPFGKYSVVHFPEKEMQQVYEESPNAEFHNSSFEQLFAMADKDTIIYCDPPYDPINKASFTAYDRNKFGKDEQKLLAECVKSSPAKVIVSNSDTPYIREIYEGCKFQDVIVRRNISCKSRDKVGELLVFNF